MTWQQIQFQIKQETADELSDLLSEFGAISVTLQDAADEPLLEPGPGETPLWQQILLTGLFAEPINADSIIQKVNSLLKSQKPLATKVSTLQEQDWQRTWLDQYKPMQFGKRLWVCPSSYKVDAKDAIIVYLDPGLAFGTGTHTTTALCLGWLEEHDLKGKTIIDYGCGSGILSIAALKLGAEKVWAVDIDPQALYATNENAKRNHILPHRLSVIHPNQLPSIQVDIIIANILAKPLIDLASSFAKHLHSQGIVVLSGVIDSQHKLVTNAYNKWFNITSVKQDNNWLLIEGEKYLHLALSNESPML